MSSDSCRGDVKVMFSNLGISNAATEHSPRRDCARYSVLRETLDYKGINVVHESIADTLTCVNV